MAAQHLLRARVGTRARARRRLRRRLRLRLRDRASMVRVRGRAWQLSTASRASRHACRPESPLACASRRSSALASCTEAAAASCVAAASVARCIRHSVSDAHSSSSAWVVKGGLGGGWLEHPRGSGWAPSGPTSPWECRHRPEPSEEPSLGSAQTV
eukprot:scaffold38028_cov79-Phaeocystis_antarctica.AAC.4